MADSSRSSTGPERGPPTMFGAFRNPSFRLLWPANFFSYVARWMQMTLLAWMVLERTDSPFLVALVGFFGMIPMFLLGAFGGVLADRLDRRKLLIATQAMGFVAALAMTVLLYARVVQYWHGYVIIFVIGAAWALDSPSRRATIHDLVGRSRVTNAIALDSLGMHASRMLGPALAGGLIAWTGVGGGYVAVTLFSLAALSLLRPLRLPRNLSQGRGSRNILRNLMDGFRYVRGQETILAVVTVTVLVNLLLFSYVQMVPVIARDVLGIGPAQMGMLMAAEGIGALAGGVLIVSRGSISHHGRVYVGGSMLASLAMLVFALSRWYTLSFPMLMVLGLGTGSFGAMQATITMLVATEEMRGRALGVIALGIGAAPLGSLMVGGMANAVTPAFALALNAGLLLVLLVLVALTMPALRRRILVEQQSGAG